MDQIIIVCIVYLNCLLVGISRGFPNLMLRHSQGKEELIQETDISWIAFLVIFPNPIGSIICGTFMDYFGRIRTLKIAILLYSICWFVVAISTEKSILYTALAGLGVSVGMLLVSFVYVAEISSEKNRGVLLSIFIIFYTSGIVLSNTITYYLHWRQSAWTFTALSVTVFAMFFLLEESPMWYMKQGRRAEAIQVLQKTQKISHGDAEKLYEHALDNLQKETAPVCGNLSLILKSWRPFAILALFQLCLQGSGIILMIMYSSKIFKNVHLPIEYDTMAITCSVSLFASSFFAPVAALGCSRKKLVYLSSVVTTAALLSILLAIRRDYGWLIPVGMCACIFFSTFGSVTVSECVPSELYRTEVRGIMCGMTQAFNTILQGFVVKMFPSILEATGVSFVLMVFGAFSFVTLFFAMFVLPETKGKTLEEIQEDYFSHKPESISVKLEPSSKVGA